MMSVIKNKYYLFIIILFISITLIPILSFLLIKHEYAFSFSLIPIVLLSLIYLKLPIIDKFKKINYFWGIISCVYPPIIVFILGIISFFFTQNVNIDISSLKSFNFITTFFATFFVIYFTEELLFRGIFWYLFDKIGYTLLKKNLFISFLFILWHVPVIILFPDFHLDLSVLPVYFLNVFILSFNFGLLRNFSNSILFISICHSIWNILVYNFFGYGKVIGIWEIDNYILLDPERGIIGILLHIIAIIIFLCILFKLKKS